MPPSALVKPLRQQVMQFIDFDEVSDYIGSEKQRKKQSPPPPKLQNPVLAPRPTTQMVKKRPLPFVGSAAAAIRNAMDSH